ncbi:MAG: hypothetical protein ACM31C_15790 [Acidobacteriota bacterium]
MARAPLQDRVAELAADVLDSFEKLDVILRLDRATSPVALDTLVAELAIAKLELVAAIDELVVDGVVRGGTTGYELRRDGKWAEHVRALVELHRTDRMEVVTLMSKASVERLRQQAARAFADAFIVRTPKKKGDGDG